MKKPKSGSIRNIVELPRDRDDDKPKLGNSRADGLFKRGMISQKQYNKMVGK